MSRDNDPRTSEKLATLERILVESLQQKKRERWLTENKGAIDAHNEHVEKHGAFGDKLRSF